MRQLTYVGPRQLEWQDVQAPKLQSDQDAIIQPMAVTRCDLDYFITTGATGWPGPFALGHETAGRVIDVGDAVQGFKPGDRVVVPFQISCGTCDRCSRGQTANCERVPFRSSYGMAPLSGEDFGGALSDFIRVPFADHMLVTCPDNVEFSTAASVADAGSDGYRLVAPHLAVNPGARVLVMGGQGQGVGLLAVQAAVAMGASEVVYMDDDPARLMLARSFGVTVMERKPCECVAPGAPYQITVDASGSAEALGLAIRSTDHGGICERAYGDLKPLTEVPLRDMYGIGVTLHIGRVHAREVMPTVLDHIQCGHLHPEEVITRTVPFADAADAMLDPTIKVLFLKD